MNSEEMRAIIEDQIRAWETGDAKRLAAGFTLEGEIVTPGKRIRGREALKETVARFAAAHSGVKVTLHRIVTGEDCAAVEYRWEDTNQESGARYVADDAVWVTFAGGLITRWREYQDNETPKRA